MKFYLGEVAQYFGPKLAVDLILVTESVNAIALISLFYLSSNKMLYWLDHMQFDNESRSFYKLNLNVSDSKRFTKQFALLLSIINLTNNFLVITVFTLISASFLLFKYDYYIYYFISIALWCTNLWYLTHHRFSLSAILYQVKICFNKTIKIYLKFIL